VGWYRHIIKKNGHYWVKKWMNYQAEGAKSRDKPKNWENEAAEKHSQNNNYARKTLQTVKTRGS